MSGKGLALVCPRQAESEEIPTVKTRDGYALDFDSDRGPSEPRMPVRKPSVITRSRGMAIASRSIRDFKDTRIEISDPWNGK